MAVAAIPVLPNLTGFTTSKLFCTSTFPHQLSVHQRPLLISHTPNPRISICHAKLHGSPGSGEPAELDMDEAFFDDDGMVEDEDSDEDETESSLDLLFRFLHSMFKKVSRRAKKASRSVLPSAISPKLVSFAVDGVLLLASLSILKALLQVVCTLGGTAFAVILLLRVVWAAIAYFQSNGNGFNQDGYSYGTTQAVT
ncbi:hypothetical protein RJ641_002945 [Dillenia turbinata]|uniref:Protein SHORT HYPOCOTYL IN WHITE LIGHT 1 n=1 Tax=Dillenia turbinata TaxID=194707 RepID=A0AAN8VPR0_9MAGN